MKVLALPRDPNPYQESVYGELRHQGVEVRYLGELTPSRTVNVMLLPFELLVGRVRGYRVLHIHWVYVFALPWLTSRSGRRAMRWWFIAFLVVARRVGLRVVWIAHNVLPHQQVFDDDLAGRRALLQRSDAVVVHASPVLDELATISRLPAERIVVRHPAYEVPATEVRRTDDLRVLFFGSIAPYKGVSDLIRAASAVRASICLTIAGRCDDPALRLELEGLAVQSTRAVQLRFERLSDSELAAALAECDLVALPFARVTTSGSALYALSAGRPLILPDAPTLADLPDSAVLRYQTGLDPVPAIAAVLETAASSDLVTMGRAGLSWAREYTWADLGSALDRVSRHEAVPA